MRYFAELDENNIVTNAWVSDNDSNNSDQNTIEFSEDKSITNNAATIGHTYNSSLNAFIPPQPDPTYILNTQTFEWEPDENLEYDLHGDGKLYRYNRELKGWTPTWDPEDNN
jgi:hypothetical protein